MVTCACIKSYLFTFLSKAFLSMLYKRMEVNNDMAKGRTITLQRGGGMFFFCLNKKQKLAHELFFRLYQSFIFYSNTILRYRDNQDSEYIFLVICLTRDIIMITQTRIFFFLYYIGDQYGSVLSLHIFVFLSLSYNVCANTLPQIRIGFQKEKNRPPLSKVMVVPLLRSFQTIQQ